MKSTKFAVIERRSNHYVVICNFVCANGAHFHDEIVFEGHYTECHNFAKEHDMILKTRECLSNLICKGSISLRNIATVYG